MLIVVMCTNEPVTREQEYSCATLLTKNTRTYQHFAPYKLITSFEPSFCSGNWGYVCVMALRLGFRLSSGGAVIGSQPHVAGRRGSTTLSTGLGLVRHTRLEL